MKKFLQSSPFVWLLIPLLAAIITANEISEIVQFSFRSMQLYILISIVFVSRTRIRHQNWLFGLLVFVLLFIIGLNQFECQNNKYVLDNRFINTESEFLVRLTDFPQEKSNSYKIPIEVLCVVNDSQLVRCRAKAIAYFSKDSSVTSLKAGQTLIINGCLVEHKEPLNYFEFDYGSYLRNKRIHYTTFVNTNNWAIVDSSVTGIRNYALGIRKDILSIYRQSGLQGNEYAVFSALTLGYKNDLDKEMQASFAGAGAMHILAVSGMHVGIIFLILKQIFALFGILKSNYKLKYIIILLCIWFYALLTGLSPSVTRAAVMATFILCGKVFGKRTNIYNSIAASAFVLLLFNTNYLFDVGFQLSYTALIGIVFFYKRIYTLIFVRNMPLNYMWQLTTIGISAQIGTFPLGIYYFNQFPTYFWATGALVVMLAYVMMFAAFVFPALSLYQPVLEFVGSIVYYVTLLLEYVIGAVNMFPFSIIEFFKCPLWKVFLIYGIVVFITFSILKRKIQALYISFILVVLLQSDNLYLYKKALSNGSVTECSINNSTMVNVIESGYCMFVVSDTIGCNMYNAIDDFCKYKRLAYSKARVIHKNDILDEFVVSEGGLCRITE